MLLPANQEWSDYTGKFDPEESLTTIGPITDAIDQMRPIMPWYAPRSRRGTKSERIISVKDRIPPDPMPCTAVGIFVSNFGNRDSNTYTYFAHL